MLFVAKNHLNSSAVTPPLKFELNQMSIFLTSFSPTIPFTLLTMATHSSMVIPALASCFAETEPSAEDPQPILLQDTVYVNCCSYC